MIQNDTKNGEDRIVPISKRLLELLLEFSKRNEFVFSSGRKGKLELQQVNVDLKRRTLL